MFKNMLKTFLSISTIGLLLSGCSTSEIRSDVYKSELLKGKEIKSSAIFKIQVANCTHHEDNYKDSEHLMDFKNKIPKIFKDAEYKGCSEDGNLNMATFKIPIYINGGITNPDYISLNSSKENILELYIPYMIPVNIEAEISKDINISMLDFKMYISFTNDYNKETETFVYSSFIDDEAVLYKKIKLNKYETINIELSDISIANAIKNQVSPILK